VRFLGQVVLRERVATDPEKISAVKDWPVPTDVKEVRSFLGLVSYYRRFLPAFAKVAAPLHALTMTFESAFQRLKGALLTSSILATPNDGDPM